MSTFTTGLLQDIRFALRGFRRSPGFTAIAVLILALGIGANSAIFSVVNAVLLRPLPYRDPDRLVTILHDGQYPVAPANFLDWRTQNHVFTGMGAAQSWSPTLTGQGQPELLPAMQVTGDLFPVLGVDPLLGRTLLPDDVQPGAGRVVVLSHRLWQSRFAGDPQVIGRTIRLNGDAHVVVGVMPPSFHFAPFWVTNAELWAPLDLSPRAADRDGSSLRLFARLGPEVTRAAAQAEMASISRRIASQFPGTNRSGEVRVDSLPEKAARKVRPALLVLLASVSLVLLIACANVANLLLARSASRRSELAIRRALGAPRARLVRQLLTESLLLAAAGGLLALVFAQAGVALLAALRPPSLSLAAGLAGRIQIDSAVLAFTFVVALTTGIAFGVAPALQASRPDLDQAVRAGSRSVTEGGSRSRLRGLLVIAEVAMALVLLIGAGLLFRSFRRLVTTDAGLDPQRVLTMVIPASGPRYPDGLARARFYQELTDRVQALPDVESVSAINHLPVGGDLWALSFTVDGVPAPAPGEAPTAVYRIIRPDYLRTLGLSLVAGRDFSARDAAGAPGVAIVNETFARTMWPGTGAARAVGQRIRVEDGGPNPRQIVGVVKDVKQERDLSTAPAREMYLAYLQNPAPRYLTLVVRTRREPLALVPLVKREVASLDGDLPVSQITSMEQVMAAAIGQPRFNLVLLNIFAGLALLLASVGIYGVVAHSVSRRTREIGIRVALGARTPEVVRLVVGQGMLLTAVGVLVGLALSLASTRLLRSLLFEVGPTDPATFVAIPALLLAVGFCACYLPARRATRIDPMVALRQE